MKKSLTLKFLLTHLLFTVLSFTVIATFTAGYAYRNCVRRSAADLRDRAEALADQCSGIYQGSAPVSEDYYGDLTWLAGLQDITVWIMDDDGTVVFDSNSRYTGQRIREFDPSDTAAFYRTGSFYEHFPEEQLSVFCPITANFRTYGYVLLHEPLTGVRAMSDSLLIPTYTTFGIIFLLSLSLLLLFFLAVEKPLKKITAAASSYAAGDLSYRVSLKSRDEMGYLADTLDYMAQELSKTEEYQRQFISNISHDFRSPLTSIKGYLEAINDGVIPPEEQEKYIDIVIGETERLTGLTQNMLSLNSLDEAGMKLHYSEFDINMVIKDTCALFEGACRSRDISFDLIFSDVAMQVHADRQRIQQVLYNLVDNAIKFSPNGSVITIEVFDRYEKVFVSVKDRGQGIPKEDIKKIWTRFYKSDTSRGRDKKGTGLGLAIVKEIISAHKENIDVISTEGVGTEFIFRLKKTDDGGFL